MTLLLTYSNSAEGTAALEQGRAIAARLGVDVVVFDLDRQSHAADRRLDAPADGTHDETGDVSDDAERWYGPAHSAPSAVDDLLDTAHELEVEAIVVGIRRRSPVGKLLMGSQAQRIILGAPVPVLTVKAKAVDE
jgi:nucleotide-binding universal stress UspA family protein